MHRDDLSLEFVRVVERAAIAAARTMGQGDRKYADQVAVEAMRKEMETLDIEGVIVAETDGPQFIGADGYWTPSVEDVTAVEDAIADEQGELDQVRQYLGYVVDGERKIFVNGFCDDWDTDWRSEPVIVLRVTPEPGAPDEGGKAALLRRILAHGFAGVRRDETRRWAEPPKLGAITAITYVGQEAGDAQPDLFSTYWVAFAQGERICKLRQRADGALDGFACV